MARLGLQVRLVLPTTHRTSLAPRHLLHGAQRMCRFGPCNRLDRSKYEQTVYFSDQVRSCDGAVRLRVTQQCKPSVSGIGYVYEPWKES
jgi:hypothetical protein